MYKCTAMFPRAMALPKIHGLYEYRINAYAFTLNQISNGRLKSRKASKMFELSFSAIFPLFQWLTLLLWFGSGWMKPFLLISKHTWTHIFIEWNGSKVVSVNYCHGVCTETQVAIYEPNAEVVVIRAAHIRINNKSNEWWIYNSIADYAFHSSIIRWMLEVFTHHIYYEFNNTC